MPRLPIANFGVGSPAGLFLPGPQPLLQPSPTGLVESLDDVGQPAAYILQPGQDRLGTADDVKLPLSNFTRTISIIPIAGEPNLREVDITVNYNTGRFQRSYKMSTYVSAF